MTHEDDPGRAHPRIKPTQASRLANARAGVVMRKVASVGKRRAELYCDECGHLLRKCICEKSD